MKLIYGKDGMLAGSIEDNGNAYDMNWNFIGSVAPEPRTITPFIPRSKNTFELINETRHDLLVGPLDLRPFKL